MYISNLSYNDNVREVMDVSEGGDGMATHHGGKVGKAGKTLATKSSSKTAKSGAGKILATHKASKH